jgi:transposase-like protein
MRPGANISDLARRAEINRGLLQTWRRAAMREAAQHGEVFVPLRLQDGSPEQPCAMAEGVPGQIAPVATGVIELESGSLRVRFSGRIDVGALRLVLGHLGRSA